MTHETTVTMANWYSAGEQRVQITSYTAVWDHLGKPVVLIRWLLIFDPRQFEPRALLATPPN
jgi:hypothetical protein